MLSALAADFHQTESGMGLAVTAYGWVGALAALLSGAMPARISRKALLVGLMLTLALSCLAATRSYSMFALMSALHDWRPGAWRLLGLNWHRRRAAGPAAPAGAGYGNHFWRRVGGKRSGGTAGELYRHPGGLATRVFGGGPAVTGRSGSAMLDAARAGRVHPRQAGCLSRYLPVIRCSAACMAPRPASLPLTLPPSPTLEPLLITLQGVPATALSGLLLLSGVSGLVGNVIAGKLIDRHLKGLIFASLLLSGGALALLGTGRLAPLPFCFSGLLLALWGAGIAIVFVGLQTWAAAQRRRGRPAGVSHLRGYF